MKIIFLSTLLSIAFPTTLIVPSDEYPTIQSGIDAATVGDNESMQIVSFCNWAIHELLNSHDGYVRDTPKKKSRDDYVD